jgi:endoribonuclease LACTB2
MAAAAALVTLADVEVLSPRVVRLLGQNPGLYTLQGTNTYVVGNGSERILVRAPAPPRPACAEPGALQVDTGDGLPAWAALLRSAAQAHGFRVAAVVLTHWHHDHVSGVADVLQLAAEAGWPRPPVYKCPDPAHDAPMSADAALVPLVDGGVVAVGGATLRAVATPGHTDDHLCLWLEEERALFAGDMVLGQGTAVFASLRAYMASLARAHALAPAVLYPGHGPVVPDGAAKLAEYLAHRRAREDQLLALLAEQAAPAPVDALVAVIYAAYPVALHVPARGSLLHHLHKLEEEGRVRRVPANGDDADVGWALLPSGPAASL